MERKPSRQEHDLDRHDRHGAPWDCAIKREQVAREHIAVGSAAFCQDQAARPRHMRGFWRIADHLQREICLQACADIGGPVVE
jgi:hypothetical protein